MIIHKTTEVDGHLIYSGSVQKNPPKIPHTDDYLLPLGETSLALPESIRGSLIALSRDHKSWYYVDDFRGRCCWSTDGEEHKITKLGPIPDGFTWVEPQDSIADKLRAEIEKKYAQIDEEARKRIEYEFYCVGMDAYYMCRIEDQANLPRRIAMCSIDGEPQQYLRKIEGDDYQMHPHTLDDLNMVLAAMDSHIEGFREIARGMKDQAMAAFVAGDIGAIRNVDHTDWGIN